jgi:hypothetical protein
MRWTHLDEIVLTEPPNQHVSKHTRAQGHPILRSMEPGEDWSWCIIDEAAFALRPR